YITIFFWSRNKMWRGLTNDLQTVLKAIALSTALQIALAPVTLLVVYPVRNDLIGNPWRVLAWLVLTVFLAPFVLGTVAGKVADWLEQLALRPEHRQEHVYESYDHLTWPLRLLFGVLPEAAPPSIWDSQFNLNR